MNARTRYPSDLTDLQWDNIALWFPEGDGSQGGRPRKYPAREVVNAILYLAHKVWADSAYRAETLTAWVTRWCRFVVEVVVRRPGALGFEVQPRRWIVERTFGWFGRYRRLAKDYEANPKSSEAWIRIAMIHRMSRYALPEPDPDHDLLKRPNIKKWNGN